MKFTPYCQLPNKNSHKILTSGRNLSWYFKKVTYSLHDFLQILERSYPEPFLGNLALVEYNFETRV